MMPTSYTGTTGSTVVVIESIILGVNMRRGSEELGYGSGAVNLLRDRAGETAMRMTEERIQSSTSSFGAWRGLGAKLPKKADIIL